MFHRRWTYLALAWTAISGAGQAEAGVVYSAPPDYTQDAYLSSNATTNSQEQLSGFTASSRYTVVAVNWWGAYNNNSLPSSETFTLAGYTENAAGTGPNSTAKVTETPLTFTRTDTGQKDVNGNGAEVYFYQATLPTPVTVAANTTDYLSIVSSDSGWAWQVADSHSGSFYFRDGGDPTPWILASNSQQLSFQLVATPEPSTLVLAGTAGLIGLARLARRGRGRGVRGS